MSDATLENVLAINEELAALSAAGVPVDLGDARYSTEDALPRINARLALRSSLGQPVAAALASEDDLPTAYQHALLTGIESHDPVLALDALSAQPTAWDDLRKIAGQSLIQPLIILMLAYLGLIVLCLSFFPTIEELYEDWRVAPTLGVRVLAVLREWMPVWIPLIPALVVVLILLWRHGALRLQFWLPGSRRYVATVRHAMLADQLAKLARAEVPLAESLRLVGRASGDAETVIATTTIAAVRESGAAWTVAEQDKISTLPPLLRWILTADLDKQSLPDLLHFATRTYEKSAERQAAVWRIALPAVVSAVLGGVIVLAYGLSLFVPYIGLLTDLAYK